MTSELPRNDPLQVVLNFAAAYTQWERDMHAAKDLQNPELQERRRQILNHYCTQKKRSYVDGIAGYRRPPVYLRVTQENIDHVEPATATRTHVDTIQFESCAYRFVVLKKQNEWRIDSLKRKFPVSGEWENTLIGS